MDKAAVPLFIEKIAKRAPTFRDLTEMALKDLRLLGGRAEIVCGPITTGGYNNVVVNLLVFNYAIEVLQNYGRPMFSQMPYEAGLADLEHEWMLKNPGAPYCHPILTEFYDPLFRSKLIAQAWFLPGWETSKGSTWERERLTDYRVPVGDLPTGWMRKLILPPYMTCV